MSSKKVEVFYCWQSDLPYSHNKEYIRELLDNIEKSPEADQHNIAIVEATSHMIGSPNITHELLEKIQNSDIFVCDASIINSQQEDQKIKKVPNPNVMVELGFAISSLGWDRIIMMFNEKYGSLTQLPFDLQKHRTTLYDSDSSDKLDLEEELKQKIIAIIEASPTKRFLTSLSNEREVEYENDLKNIKRFFGTFLLEHTDEHFQNMPRKLNTDILSFFEDLDRFLGSNSVNFRLYDTKLFDMIQEFYTFWHRALPALEEVGNYREAGSPDCQLFVNRGDAPLSKTQQAVWDRIEENKHLMHLKLNEILERVHLNYKSINIDEIQKKLKEEWVDSREKYTKQHNR